MVSMWLLAAAICKAEQPSCNKQALSYNSNYTVALYRSLFTTTLKKNTQIDWYWYMWIHINKHWNTCITTIVYICVCMTTEGIQGNFTNNTHTHTMFVAN